MNRKELEDLSDWQLKVARNEIYARLGRSFKDKKLQEYFMEKSWYHPDCSPEEFDEMGDAIFNEYEYANKTLITEIEKER